MAAGQSDTAADGVEFVITRAFNAPRALVFKAMTQAEHLRHWWGPRECEIVVASHALQPGGAFHYRMRFPAGDIWGKFVYREIDAPQRLVVVNGFADAEGNVTRYVMSPSWPLEVLNTTTLIEQDGVTTLTLRSHPIGASALEFETFKAGHASMREGFGGMYDKFEQYLALLADAA